MNSEEEPKKRDDNAMVESLVQSNPDVSTLKFKCLKITLAPDVVQANQILAEEGTLRKHPLKTEDGLRKRGQNKIKTLYLTVQE